MAKTLKADSLYALRFVSEPQLSPDGRWVVAVHSSIDASSQTEPPRYRSQLYLYDSHSGEERSFSQGLYPDSQPRFSPDSSMLAFLSKRPTTAGESQPQAQLHCISLAGGEAQALSHAAQLPAGVSSFVWHPDGQRLALIARSALPDERLSKGAGRRIDRLHYKADGVGFSPESVAQVYMLERTPPAEGDALRCLSDFSCDADSLCADPQGKYLYVCAANNPDDDAHWRSDIWRISLKSGKVKRLVSSMLSPYGLSPSPDGTRLAFFSASNQENSASATGIWSVDNKGKESPRLHSGDLECSPSIGGDSRYGRYPNTVQWSEDGSGLYFNLNQRGRSALAKLELNSNSVEALQSGDHAVTSFHHAASYFVFTAESPEQPGELYIRDSEGQERQLSHANAAFVARYSLASASAEQHCRSGNGSELSYWLLRPHKARKDDALVLQVHGGPHTNYGYGFYFEFQLLAAAGYTVVYGNPRGSSSYGSSFATCMQGDYGGIDAEDVMAIANAAKAQHSDPDAPMHLTGGSYGGFMTNWLIGQSSMFRSAVSQRSICNWLSFHGTSDIGYVFGPREVNGNPWQDVDKLWQQSPLKYVAAVQTPLLLIHSEADHRCPIEQAEQFYTALKQLGHEVSLLRFPEEGHELSRSGRPDRRVERLEAVLEWFETHA